MKLLIKFLLASVLFFISIKGYTQPLLEVNAWNNFEGTIGSENAQISLYLFKDNSIKGNYIYQKGSKKTSLVGYLKSNAIILNEANDNKSGFKGNTFTDTADKFEGTFTNTVSQKIVKFKFNLSSITWGDYDHRYTDLYGSDEEIENFMNAVKAAILSGNKLWLVDHVHYPTRQFINGHLMTIKNKELFIKYYNQIFTSRFINKIKSDYTTDLFTKDGEAMLGNGEIWIGNPRNSSKSEFIITAINPPVY